MNRRSHWAIIGFFACIGSLIHVYVYRLEARVRRIDRLDSVNARSHVDSYFEVARVYLREGRTDDARESLLKGLKLDAWNFEGQISLARIEMDEGQLETAAERARFVTTHGPPGWMPEARKILEHPTAAGLVDRTRALPQVEGAVLYLLGFEGISDTLLEFMKGQISREYSISVDGADGIRGETVAAGTGRDPTPGVEDANDPGAPLLSRNPGERALWSRYRRHRPGLGGTHGA